MEERVSLGSRVCRSGYGGAGTAAGTAAGTIQPGYEFRGRGKKSSVLSFCFHRAQLSVRFAVSVSIGG